MATVRRPVRAQAERPDPKGQEIDGQLGRFELKNRDAEQAYIWASEHGDYDVGYYESGGYEIVRYEEGGPAPLRGGVKRTGEPVRQQGYVLMSRPKAIHKEEFDSGQRGLDAIEQRIYNKSFGRHEIKNIRGLMGVDVINDTTQAYSVTR